MQTSLAVLIGIGIVFVFMLAGKASSKYCDGGHFCVPPKQCCSLDCCYDSYSPPGYRPPSTSQATPNILSIIFWNYWFVIAFLVVSCIGGCSLWRRWGSCLPACCCQTVEETGSCDEDSVGSGRDSAGSCYPPPQYSRCSSFHHAPPPYTEVTSKPDLYPLVFSYGDNGKPGSGSNYLMVQYFRNYIVRPVGSLSAASTADSLSSSFLCNAANEANTVIPPPYSCAGSLDEFRTSTPLSTSAPPPPLLLRSISSLTSFHNNNLTVDQASPAEGHPQQPSRSPSCELPANRRPGGGTTQGFISATALSTTGSDISSIAGIRTPDSPPRATSPTLEIRELLDKIQQLPNASTASSATSQSAEDCPDTCAIVDPRTKRYNNRYRGSLYMPLCLGGNSSSGCHPNSRHKMRPWLTRSAPTTPSTPLPPPSFLCGALPPPRPASQTNRRRQGSGTEDGSPLLAELGSGDEQDRDGQV